jgi:hypothetical protein
MRIIKEYVRNNSSLLFNHEESDTILALFDQKGFSFTPEAQNNYNQIRHEPHLYVAWRKNEYNYIGKSFQAGGRWKRSHAYHLGTLAHDLLGTIRYDDQNHAHWIEHWMNRDTVEFGDNQHSIELEEEVFICFIPFSMYSELQYNTLEKAEIKRINKISEKQLTQSYLQDGISLLNVQNNNGNQ